MKIKRLAALVLGLTVAAGGTFVPGAAAEDVGDYRVFFSVSNAPIYEVDGLFETDLQDVGVDLSNSSVAVDGKGKITGFAIMLITNLDATATIVADVSGSMGVKGTSTTVQMSVKGTGWARTLGGTSTGAASLNLKFTGTGTTLGSPHFGGTASGSFKTGIKGIANATIKNADAVIDSDHTEYGNVIENCNLSMALMPKSAVIAGCIEWNGDGFHDYWFGTAKGTATGFTMNLKGLGPATGAKLVLKGNISDGAGGSQVLSNMSATGTYMGQKINATSGGGGELTPIPE
jgi:hypothetical protein